MVAALPWMKQVISVSGLNLYLIVTTENQRAVGAAEAKAV